MYRQILTALTFLQLTEAASEKAQPPKALQFGTTFDDFVKWYPDMSKIKKDITVCAWIKKQLEGNARSWVTYTTSNSKWEILISDAGTYNYIHESNKNVVVSVPLNTWTLQCNSWSTSSSTNRIYYNGTMVGYEVIDTTEPLEEGGFITLGHDGGSQDAHEIFGGQMMRLNIYGKELRADEIKEMYNGGRCSDEVEKKLEDVRHITWESILSKAWTGNVTEVDSGCPIPEEVTEEEEEEEEEECQCPEKKYSLWDVLYQDLFFNKTLTDEALEQFKTFWNVLDYFVGTTMSERIIAHFKLYHPMIVKKCETD